VTPPPLTPNTAALLHQRRVSRRAVEDGRRWL
jgi:hypothetical protein